MSALTHSALLVLSAGVGDKTQLLAAMLAAKYRKPFPIICGIIIATILNFSLAVWLGREIGSSSGCGWLTWVISIFFIGIGLWILEPGNMDVFAPKYDYGALLTTIVAFFMVEMGSRSQLAAIAVGAEYRHFMPAFKGASLGMVASCLPVIFFGQKFIDKTPMRLCNYIAAALFIWFGFSRVISFG